MTNAEAFKKVISALQADAEQHEQKAAEGRALAVRLMAYVALSPDDAQRGKGRPRVSHTDEWLAADRVRRRDRQRERRRLQRLAAAASVASTSPKQDAKAADVAAADISSGGIRSNPARKKKASPPRAANGGDTNSPGDVRSTSNAHPVPPAASPSAPDETQPACNGNGRPNGRSRKGIQGPAYPKTSLSDWCTDEAGNMSRVLVGEGKKQQLRGEDF